MLYPSGSSYPTVWIKLGSYGEGEKTPKGKRESQAVRDLGDGKMAGRIRKETKIFPLSSERHHRRRPSKCLGSFFIYFLRV